LVGLSLVAGAGLLLPVAVASPASAAGSNAEASKSATAILADAKAATKKAHSVHVVGTISDSGSTTTINMVVGHGQGGGTLSEGAANFDIVVHQGKVYLKAGKATWTKLANASAAALLANRWLQTTTSNQDFAQLTQVADIVQLTDSLSPGGKLVKEGNATFHGQPAIGLLDTSKDGGTLYVAARGVPYILGVAGAKKKQGGVQFTQYNSAKVPPAPKGAINLNQLESGSGTSSSTTTGGSTTAGA
jgi:hypothetical protein